MSLRTVARTTTTTVTGFVALVLVGGCVIGTDETEGGPAPGSSPYANEASFCEAVAKAQCSDAVVQGCYSSDSESLAEDKASCVAQRKSTSVCNPRRLKYGKANAKACVDAHTAAYKDGSISSGDVDAIDAACMTVLYGGGTQGASCTRDDDCDTPNDLRCVNKSGDVEGICIVPTEVGAGLDCSANDAECIEGFYCNASDDCVGLEGNGSGCGIGMPCEEGLSCSAESDGVCFPKGGNSDPCDTGDECASGFCTIATGSNEGRCTATLTFQSTSKSCEDFL